MKSSPLLKSLTLLLFSCILAFNAFSQKEKKNKKIIQDAENAKVEFLKSDPEMENLMNSSYGYVILPNVGKGGLGVGAAAGKGVAYEKGKKIGTAQMTQATIGFQAGGEAYREIIFFETEEAFERFKANKIEFTAQVSAVAVKAGASANAKYIEGILIFTQSKGGLMYEASLGGQKLKFTAE